MAASTSTTTFNKQNKQREWKIIQVLLSLHKLSCIEWQKQRHCFTQNRMTRTESQIKLNNQVLLSVHNTKFTTLLLLLYIVFASLIYKSKKLKIMRIIKLKVHWCTIHIRCWVEIPCHAQFYLEWQNWTRPTNLTWHDTKLAGYELRLNRFVSYSCWHD